MIWFFYSFISALFSAASALTQKKVLKSLEAFDFCLLISGLNVLFALNFFFVAPWKSLESSIFFLIVFKSFLNAFGFWSVMKGIKTLELSRGLPLLALTPAFVAFGGLLFLKESLGLYESLGIGLIVLGTFILEFHEGKMEWKKFSQHGALFLALLFMTINTLMDRYIVGPLKISPPLVMALTQASFLVFFLILWIFVKSPFERLYEGAKKSWPWLILIALFTLTYRYTNLLALTLAPAAMVIAVKRSSIFFATSLGGKIFKEGHLKKRILAAFFLVVGTMLLFKYGG